MKYSLRNWIAICLLSFCSAVATAEPAAPNVVYILCDDQAWFDFGFMGSETIATPNLDRLAQRSAVFTHGYVTNSLCLPSLASIITGRFPHEHLMGVGLDGLRAPPATIEARFAKHVPIPQRLASAGYLSLQTGKWWAGDFHLAGFTHGMTTARGIAGSSALDRPDAVGNRHIGRLDQGMSLLAGGEGLRIGREGLGPIERFIKARDDKPFFIWYAPMMPHTPHDPPRRLFEKYSRIESDDSTARYMAMCEWFDETVGELMSILDKEDVADNTLIIFITDNGYIPARGLDGWFHPRSKASPYEAGVRTPIMLHWPGRISPARYDTPVSSIDLLPTTLAACGLPVSNDLPGMNLLDVCDGRPLNRDAVFGASFRNKVEKPAGPADTVGNRWCVAFPWKLIEFRGPDDDRVELYNLRDDPHETTDLAAARPAEVERILRKINDWWPIDEDQQ